MATKRQIAANRRNARHSTGPKTPLGKATASMNALRHGLRARTVVVPGERQEDFDQIHDGLQGLYQPENPAEQHLVDQAAIAQWKLVRAEAFEARCYADEPSAQARAAILGRMTQIQCRLERTYFKAYKELERIKAARRKQPEQPEANHQADHLAPKFQVAYINPETGERDVIYRAEYGKSVEQFSDASPSPTKPNGKEGGL
jgi:uncharacterized protein (DUF2132 family)